MTFLNSNLSITPLSIALIKILFTLFAIFAWSRALIRFYSKDLNIKELIFWLAILSLGVGLFNLIPLGPIDGGRMFLTALEHLTHQARAATIWKSVSFVVLGILLTNVVLAFV